MNISHSFKLCANRKWSKFNIWFFHFSAHPPLVTISHTCDVPRKWKLILLSFSRFVESRPRASGRRNPLTKLKFNLRCTSSLEKAATGSNSIKRSLKKFDLKCLKVGHRKEVIEVSFWLFTYLSATNTRRRGRRKGEKSPEACCARGKQTR